MTANSLVSLSNDLASLVEQTGPSVVAVHARPRFHSSGVHWSHGVIVTAEHALQKDEEIAITTQAGEKLEAILVGRDAGTDLAVLRVKDLSLPIATQRADTDYRTGDLALVVGRNKDSVNASLGVVSSIGGASQTWRGGKLDRVVRLDVALHPASAGAAVVDAAGQVIGIATPVLSRAAVFAIPNATVERVVQALLSHGRLRQGYLGAGLQPIALPQHLITSLALESGTGLMTVSVDDDGPAAKAGLMIGDVLLALNGTPVQRPEGLRPLLAEFVDKPLAAKVLRGGELTALEFIVGERPGR